MCRQSNSAWLSDGLGKEALTLEVSPKMKPGETIIKKNNSSRELQSVKQLRSIRLSKINKVDTLMVLLVTCKK